MAGWYNINPFTLEDDELLFLDTCIERLKAEKEVHHRGCESELTPDRTYNIVLHLTGDEDEAQKQKAYRWLAINR